MKYYIDKDSKDKKENFIHREGCKLVLENQEYLGDFLSCPPAIKEAKYRGYENASECPNCSESCNI